MDSRFTCIIPTYTNTKGLTLLLESLRDQSIPVIVVDNHPTEEKKGVFNKPNIVYIPQNKNIGFAAAVNRGVEQAKTPWVFIMNDDIEIQNISDLDKLIDFAKEHEYRAVSPVLNDKQGNIENMGYFVFPIGKVLLNYNLKNAFSPKNGFHDISFLSMKNHRNIDGLTAACLLLDRKIFLKVGGFDETFFAYLEDVDLFLRLKKNGYGFGIDTNKSVLHHHLTSSQTMKGFKEKQDLKNWIRIIAKHWQLNILFRHLIPIVVERLRNISGFLKIYL